METELKINTEFIKIISKEIKLHKEIQDTNLFLEYYNRSILIFDKSDIENDHRYRSYIFNNNISRTEIPEKFNLHNYSNILHKTLNWNDIQYEHINGHTTFFVKLNKIESKYFIEYYIRTKHLVNNNLIQTNYPIYRQLVSLLQTDNSFSDNCCLLISLNSKR